MSHESNPSTAAAWARFRFSVVGALLSAPPARGDLNAALSLLAEKTWTHPVLGEEVRFAVGTIERWYYTARREKDDPVGVLRRTVRKDCGTVSLAAKQIAHLRKQHEDYPHWTYRLHYDNLAAAIKAQPDAGMGALRSYSTVRRYMQAHGLVRKPRPRPQRPGEIIAAQRREKREVRGYEAEFVGALWHLDFHHGSRKVVTSRGEWQQPIVLAILDDHSRLCCHLQWYLSETAADLVHGLSQAIQKRGLPRALLTDNGSAMVAEEVGEGLLRLGVVHEKTLPYSPYQNGKQEVFWATLEGRLMEMLDGCTELSLDFLNQASQAWVEIEYHRAVHRETGCSPLDRFAQARDVLRTSPSSDALREAFRLESKRRQRQGDGTISVEGVRFEVPSRYRHFQDVTVRYARWDFSRVDLVDPRNGTILAPLHPQDRTANADGRRPPVETADRDSAADAPADAGPRAQRPLPPLLKQILDGYSALGTPPAYLPKEPGSEKGGAES